MFVKHEGNWKEVQQMYVKKDGVWKEVSTFFVKNSGVWKEQSFGFTVFAATMEDPTTAVIDITSPQDTSHIVTASYDYEIKSDFWVAVLPCSFMDRIHLAWSNVVPNGYYEIQYSTTGLFTEGNYSSVFVTGESVYLSGMNVNTTYHVRIKNGDFYTPVLSVTTNSGGHPSTDHFHLQDTAPSLAAGLIHYWPFIKHYETADGRAADIVGGLHLSPYSNYDNSPYSDLSNEGGLYLHNNQYFSIPPNVHNGSLDFKGECAFSLWFRPKTFPTETAILFMKTGKHGDENGDAYKIGITSSGSLFSVPDGSGLSSSQPGSWASTGLGSWYHYVFRIYCNNGTWFGEEFFNDTSMWSGVLDGLPDGRLSPYTGTFWIGTDKGGGRFANVTLSHLSFWNRYLSNNEITELYKRRGYIVDLVHDIKEDAGSLSSPVMTGHGSWGEPTDYHEYYDFTNWDMNSGVTITPIRGSSSFNGAFITNKNSDGSKLPENTIYYRENSTIGGLVLTTSSQYYAYCEKALLPHGSCSWSLSSYMYIQDDRAGDHQTYFSQYTSANDAESFYFGIHVNGQFRLSTKWDGTTGLVYGKDILEGWHLVTLVNDYENNDAHIYIDGIKRASKGSVLGYSGTGNFYIGRQGTHPAEHPFGCIADLKIWYRTLNEKEVNKLYCSYRTDIDKNYGRDKTKPGKSGVDIIRNNQSAYLDDGIYWIKPEGFTGNPYRMYCNMTREGGGWERFLYYRDDGTPKSLSSGVKSSRYSYGIHTEDWYKLQKPTEQHVDQILLNNTDKWILGVQTHSYLKNWLEKTQHGLEGLNISNSAEYGTLKDVYVTDQNRTLVRFNHNWQPNDDEFETLIFCKDGNQNNYDTWSKVEWGAVDAGGSRSTGWGSYAKYRGNSVKVRDILEAYYREALYVRISVGAGVQTPQQSLYINGKEIYNSSTYESLGIIACRGHNLAVYDAKTYQVKNINDYNLNIPSLDTNWHNGATLMSTTNNSIGWDTHIDTSLWTETADVIRQLETKCTNGEIIIIVSADASNPPSTEFNNFLMSDYGIDFSGYGGYRKPFYILLQPSTGFGSCAYNNVDESEKLFPIIKIPILPIRR